MSRITQRPGRDDQLDWRTCIARDDRAAGLRERKRDRRMSKTTLKSGDGGTLLNGKRRR